MTDDRMDERLRDYAARWTAARLAPATVPVAARASRGGRWVPVAAAASVVALLAGIAYAFAPRRSPVPPLASASASASASTAGAPDCEEEQVRGEVSLRRADGLVTGTLALSAPGGQCTIPHAPRLAVVGDQLRDLGVGYRFAGTDGPVVLTPAPRRLELTWSPRFCPETSVVVLMVTIREEHAFRLPLDKETVPPCESAAMEHPNTLRAQWEQRRCATGDWAVVSGGAARQAQGVGVSLVLRNVSGDVCDHHAKPFLTVRGADGREAKLAHSMTLELRHGPGVPPGAEVKAAVWWLSYCGPALGEYTATLSVHEATIAVPLTDRPVPPCDPSGRGEDVDGNATSGWMTELPR